MSAGNGGAARRDRRRERRDVSARLAGAMQTSLERARQRHPQHVGPGKPVATLALAVVELESLLDYLERPVDDHAFGRVKRRELPVELSPFVTELYRLRSEITTQEDRPDGH